MVGFAEKISQVRRKRKDIVKLLCRVKIFQSNYIQSVARPVCELKAVETETRVLSELEAPVHLNRLTNGLRLATALSLGVAALASCSGHPSFKDASLSKRQFELEKFFDGKFVAHGQFQDRFGAVRRQFEVKIDGKWDGSNLKLVENFVYEDGSTEQRVWTLHKTGAKTWEGTAPGVIGVATGEVQGDRFNWKYTIDLPVPSAGGKTTTTRVSFDDWIWLLSDTRAFNRAYMMKYGITLGDVSISFEKL